MFIYLLRHAVAAEPADVHVPLQQQPQTQEVLPVDAPNAAAPSATAAVEVKVPPKAALHAVNENTDEALDANRPLTKDGRKKMEIAARGLDRCIPGPIDVILTSPYVRAKETARIAAEALKAEKKVRLCPELTPGTSYPKLLKALAKYKTRKHIMLVGHAPDLTAAAAALLGSDTLSVEMKKGAVCCIEVTALTGKSSGKLVWLMQPKQLRQLAK
jgi:phosphohistidine phosphatase